MGINVNLVDQDQNSALHYAIKTDNPALVHLVLNAGANINKQNAEGLTAFDLAVKGRNAQLLRVIQAAGGLSGAEFTAPATKEEGKTEKLSDEDWVKKALGIEEPEPEEEPEVQAAEPEEVEPTPIPTPEPTPTPAPTPVRPERPETTQVRALGRPTGVWVRKGGLTLDSVTVRAKNMSHIEAKEVKVKVRLPDGDIVAVTGPTTLGRFETGTYTASVGKEIFSGKKLKAIVTCGNCYK
jgi:ankyrin repeat protein